jgi:hypothetical protein
MGVDRFAIGKTISLVATPGCRLVAVPLMTVSPALTANELPPPSGKLGVGVMSYVWTDVGRDEV